MGDSISKRIRKRINKIKTDNLFTIRDFADLNNDSAVTRTLSRLQNESAIVRVATGIYMTPKGTQFSISAADSGAYRTTRYICIYLAIDGDGSTADSAIVGSAYRAAANGNRIIVPCGNSQTVVALTSPPLFTVMSR